MMESLSLTSLEAITALSSRNLPIKSSRGGLYRQILATSLAASFNIVFGISLAYSAILNPELAKETSDIQTKEDERSWVASVMTLSMPVAAPVGGILMDRIGRLNTVKLACIPGVIGWTLIATSSSFPTLIAGRIITGIASVLGTAPAIVYITEIARSDLRGSLISFGPCLSSVGMVIAYIEGWVFSWQLTAWLSVLYSILSLILLMLIPDSPVWLLTKDKNEKAMKSLEWLMNVKPSTREGTVSHELVDIEFTILKKVNDDRKAARQRKLGLMGILNEFSKPTGYKPFLILLGLFVFQQFSGVYVTLFYSIEFFEETGTNINPYLCSVFIGLVRAIMSAVNVYMLKKFRRRTLLIASCIGMSLTMLVSGSFTNLIANGTTKQKWVPVFAILLYVIASMIGMLTIPWTMTAELFPIEIRAIAHSSLYAVAFFLMFLSIQYYQHLKRLCKGVAGVQWFFGAVSLVAAIYTFLLLPETSRTELTEIEEYFTDNTFYLCRRKIPHSSEVLE